ncbi:MAG: hypothetical protein JSU86_09245 [Phycisphaerales bacterium]|nr:MAG: hypothetical protein JSU86_09245 [Phycisphaerales bacterium]
MFRKVIIVLLTLGAMGTAALWVLSVLDWPVDWAYYDRSCTSMISHESLFGRPVPVWIVKVTHSSMAYSKLHLSQGIISVAWGRGVPSGSVVPAMKKLNVLGLKFSQSVSVRGSGGRNFFFPAPLKPLNVSQGFEVGVSRGFSVSLSLPCVPFCTCPTLAFIRGPVRRSRRRRQGLCLRCGYNLTGNVSGVCPECGTDNI